MAVIGLVAAVLPFLLSGEDRDSSTDTLVVGESARPSQEQASESQSDEVILAAGQEDLVAPIGQINETEMAGAAGYVWGLPVSADVSTFPFSAEPMGECLPDQREWFEAVGSVDAATGWTLAIDIANDATSGGAISLTNIRFVGEVADSERMVRTNCGVGGIGGPGLRQMIDLYLDASPATWAPPDLAYLDPADVMPEGEIATVNLGAGEIATIEFVLRGIRDELGPGRSVTGRVVADMISPEATEVVILDDITIEGVTVAGFDLALADSPRSCILDGTSLSDSSGACTIEDAQLVLTEAAVP